MSTTVRGYGWVALLASPVKKEEIEALSNKLWDEGSQLNINYEGTLAFFDYLQGKPTKEREGLEFVHVGHKGSVTDLADACSKYGLKIMGLALPFNAIWNTSCDNPMNELTRDEFRENLRG